MEAFIETILGHDITKTVIEYVNSMSETEITIVVIIVGLLILFIMGRWFGSGAVIAISIIYVMIYALWAVDIFKLSDNYEKQKSDSNQIIIEELEKK